jgi:hypothetical protein
MEPPWHNRRPNNKTDLIEGFRHGQSREIHFLEEDIPKGVLATGFNWNYWLIGLLPKR